MNYASSTREQRKKKWEKVLQFEFFINACKKLGESAAIGIFALLIEACEKMGESAEIR